MAALVLFIFKDLLLQQVIIVLDVRLQVSLGGVRQHRVHRAGVTLGGRGSWVTPTVRLAGVLPT